MCVFASVLSHTPLIVGAPCNCLQGRVMRPVAAVLMAIAVSGVCALALHILPRRRAGGVGGAGLLAPRHAVLARSEGLVPAPVERAAQLLRGLSGWWAFEDDPLEAGGVFLDGSVFRRGARSSSPGLGQSNRVPRGGQRTGCGHAMRLRGPDENDQLIVDRSAGAGGLDLGSAFTVAIWILQFRHVKHARTHWQSVLDNGVSGRYVVCTNPESRHATLSHRALTRAAFEGRFLQSPCC